MGPVGFVSFGISDVRKTLRDKISAGKDLYSPFIEIHGVKWRVGIENKENEFFGIYLFREDKEK